jgi:aconitate hydratase
VIARSFARIHEANLKKQGLLALTFSDATDYERVCERDRISLVRLGSMAPGDPIECRIAHEDGTSETLWLRHTCSDESIAWFRAGSALNAVSRRVTEHP